MSKLGNRPILFLIFTLFLLSSCTLKSRTTSDAPDIDNFTPTPEASQPLTMVTKAPSATSKAHPTQASSATPKPSSTKAPSATSKPSLTATKTAIPSSTKAPSVTPKPSSTETPSVTVSNSPTSSPTIIVIPTPNPAEPLTEYRDDRLCFVVEVPKTWRTDGTRGGFAAFTPPNQSTFNISHASLAQNSTLQQAQEHLQQGPLGAYVDQMKEFEIDKEPAQWVSFTESEFQFVALVIAPDCGDGQHALFISARRPTDQSLFEWFLRHVRFIG